MDGWHIYEPRSGHGLPHDPFNAIVGPRPIGWISTVSAAGQRNLAPYSFFNAFNYTPPTIGFSSVGEKDTVRNIRETGEFVWNLADETLAAAMNATCAMVGPEVDEFTLAGLKAAPSALVKPPRVAASAVAFECRLTQQIPLTDAEGAATPAIMTFGEVVRVVIRKDLLRDGVFDTLAARPLLRGGGPGDYFGLSAEHKRFMPRPR